MGTPRVRFRGIAKRFGGLAALRDVSFDVAAGSCHAICGENGAGKSTLGRILAGVHRPDGGTIEIDGQAAGFRSPREALGAGIAMVHQELAACGNLTVADNLCLRELPRRFGLVDERALRERSIALLAEVGASIDPSRRMDSLSIAEQQLVQIAAAVAEGARVIIFDEPTSSLSEGEAARLYELIGELKARGVTQLYVSHRMPEILALCDTVTVLRDGAHVATGRAAALTTGAIVSMMIGRELAEYFPAHANRARGEERLRVEGLTSATGRFHDISFSVHAGEVVGMAGLVGAGRSEIARAIFGLDRATGRVRVRGSEVAIRSPRDAMRRGFGFVPEDRKTQGLVLGLRAGENASLPTLTRFARLGWVDQAAERRESAGAFSQVGLRAAPHVLTSTLSGGNQQKIVLAKWLMAESEILILDEPTRGIDVGAKAELHAWIDRKAAESAAILLISSEIPELLALSTRVLVLREGRLRGELARGECSQDALIRLMTGVD